MKKTTLLAAMILFLSACHNTRTTRHLPVLSKYKTVNNDTVYQPIPHFQLIDQDSVSFDSRQLHGKIHVADFFFTSCPGICPIMSGQMSRLQEMTKAIPPSKLLLVSFTVDPKRDTPSRLKSYGKSHRADFNKWKFLTGPMDSIYRVGISGYYLGMQQDSTAEGGYLHSGKFVLVDGHGLIRGYYDGTKADEVNRLYNDLQILLEDDQ